MTTGNFYYLKLAKELNAIARKVLRFYYDRGIKIILTDLDTILKNS